MEEDTESLNVNVRYVFIHKGMIKGRLGLMLQILILASFSD